MMAHEVCMGPTVVPCPSCAYGMLTPAKLQSCLEGNLGLESFCSSHMNLHFKTKTFTQETKHLYSTFLFLLLDFEAALPQFLSIYIVH